jgi:hypothetical protein
MEVSDHVPHRTTYGQNNSWVVHEIPVECAQGNEQADRGRPVCFAVHRRPLYWNFMYHSRMFLSVNGSVWYVVWNLHCTDTIDSVLANSKTQNAFLFPVHAMFHHDCSLAVKPASMPQRLVHKNLERFSTYWYAPLRRDHPSYCTAEVGNPRGSYELPCTLIFWMSQTVLNNFNAVCTCIKSWEFVTK